MVGLALLSLGGRCASRRPAPLPTNLIQNSEAFNAWTLLGVTVTQNVASGPVSGNAVVDRMVEAAGLQQHSLTAESISFASGIEYTFSVWAKSEAGSSQFVQLLLGSGAFGINAWCNFDIQNGTVETKGSAATGAIQDWGDGWHRLIMTATATSAASAPAVVFGANSATMSRALSYTGDAGNTRLLFGAQVESGASANTYNPT